MDVAQCNKPELGNIYFVGMGEVSVRRPGGPGGLPSLTRSAPDLPQLTDKEQQLIMEVLHRDEQLRRQDNIRIM